MIQTLRMKFVLVAVISVAAMLFVVVTVAGVFNYADLNRKTDAVLSLIAQNGGSLPKPDKKEKPPHNSQDLPREAMFDTRYFVVYLGGNREILFTDTGNIYAATAQMAQEYAVEALNQGRERGYLDEYKYLVAEIKGKPAIVFVDASRDIRMVRGSFYNSSMISLAALLLVAVISYVLSPIAVKPIAIAYEKQKRFITNASHEIKTPLTVISANLDIVEMSSGENKWLNSAKEQIVRLTGLVNSLVSLSRMEEAAPLEKALFSLSELSEMVAESYDGIAVSHDKAFETAIAQDISYLGDEKSISQLLYILLDNAFQYSGEKGRIFFSLGKKQDKILLSVENTAEAVSVGRHQEFFDRFYREDKSRNSKIGGFGIGLSLAKSIVERHRGKISAKSTDGKSLCVQVIL